MALENLYKWCVSGSFGGIAPKYIAREAAIFGIPLPEELAILATTRREPKK